MHGSSLNLFINKLFLWHHLARMMFYFYQPIFRIATPAILLLFITVLMSSHAKAEADETPTNVSINSLGDLQVQYALVQESTHYADIPLTAKVSYALSEQYMLIAPFMPQQTAMLLPHGSPVKKGQAIAKLSGSEVHHFQEMLVSQQFVLTVNKERYVEGKILFEKGAISVHKWVEIAEQYHDNLIAFGHLKHFAELIQTDNNDKESVTLIAPSEGLLLYPQMVTKTTDEPVLAVIVPLSQVKLAIAAPINQATSIISVESPFCESATLAIASQEHTADNFHVTLWSEPVSQQCQLQLGQTIRVTPNLARTTQVVPKNSVFSWQQTPHVMVKQGLQLVPTPVNIITSEPSDSGANSYFIEPMSILANSEILSSSVSAVQGMLAGMGGE